MNEVFNDSDQCLTVRPPGFPVPFHEARQSQDLVCSLMGATSALPARLLGEVILKTVEFSTQTESSLPLVLSGSANIDDLNLVSLTNAVPRCKPEIERRLKREGVKTGDLQISLT
mgnify:CR=1 FL=1